MNPAPRTIDEARSGVQSISSAEGGTYGSPRSSSAGVGCSGGVHDDPSRLSAFSASEVVAEELSVGSGESAGLGLGGRFRGLGCRLLDRFALVLFLAGM
jgi:hypothetical protein